MTKIPTEPVTSRSRSRSDHSRTVLTSSCRSTQNQRPVRSARCSLPIHLSFPLVLLLFLCAGGPETAQAAYDVCYDEMMEKALACSPGTNDVIPNSGVTVTVEPASGTCGNPASTYRLMGDRVSSHTVSPIPVAPNSYSLVN